jgi:hypothetical protein
LEAGGRADRSRNERGIIRLREEERRKRGERRFVVFILYGRRDSYGIKYLCRIHHDSG